MVALLLLDRAFGRSQTSLFVPIWSARWMATEIRDYGALRKVRSLWDLLRKPFPVAVTTRIPLICFLKPLASKPGRSRLSRNIWTE